MMNKPLWSDPCQKLQAVIQAAVGAQSVDLNLKLKGISSYKLGLSLKDVTT